MQQDASVLDTFGSLVGKKFLEKGQGSFPEA